MFLFASGLGSTMTDTAGGAAATAEIEDLRARLAEILDPLTLLAGIFAHAPFGIQIYEAGGSSVLTDRAFRELFGSEPPPGYNVLEDEIARSAGVLDLIHRAFRGEVVHVPAVWYDPRDLTQVNVAVGARVAIESTFLPLFDRHGAVTHVAIVFKDLTAELKLRERAELERDLLQRLVGVLGHDLQTPLTAILATGAQLLRGQPDPVRLRTGLLRIRQSGSRMRRMIANIVDLTRIRVRGELPLARRSTDLGTLARSTLEELEAAAPDRPISLRVDGDTAGRWDPDRLAQVLTNLGSNALAYAREGSAIEVEVTGRGDEVVVGVHNDGPEIPPDQLATIFEPFRRGTTSEQATASPGLGLGLYIVREIVEAHGGRVSVASSAPMGTRVELVLPRSHPGRGPAAPR